MKIYKIEFLIILIFLAVMSWLVIMSADKSEIVECQKLQSQSKEYPAYNSKTQTGFYITKWQAEQCKAHSMQIDATVL